MEDAPHPGTAEVPHPTPAVAGRPPRVPCTTVLSPGPGVCAVCRGPAGPDRPVCFCCAAVAGALASPLAPVVPISTCRIPGPLYSVLRDYKDSPVSDARRHHGRWLSVLLSTFLAAHRSCLDELGGGRLDVTVAVPPTSRPGEAPLHALAGPAWSRGLLVRGAGLLGHLRPSVHGFEVPAGERDAVDGTRVLLIDDTLTTGARVQSAAAGLRSAGALAVVAVVVGRVVRPELNPRHAAYWARARAEEFSLGRCSIPGCPGGGTDPADPGRAADPADPGRAARDVSGWRPTQGRSPACRP